MAGLPVGAGVGGLGQAVAGGYRHSFFDHRATIIRTLYGLIPKNLPSASTTRHVALKEHQPGQVGAPAARARLFDDAWISGRLEHPGGVAGRRAGA
jgi:hypothetical protein